MRSARGSLLLALALGACAAAPVVPPTAAATPLPPLAGTRWAAPVVPGSDGHGTPRLEFAEGGVLHGYTGCNMLSGHWHEDGNQIRFSELVVTKRFCVGVGSEVEKQVLAALSAQSLGRREGGRLIVESPQGARFEYTPAAAA